MVRYLGCGVVLFWMMACCPVALFSAHVRPIPNKLVVLSFDDGNRSDVTFVAPLLKRYGFNATFYVTSDWLGRPQRLTWEDVKKLQDDGFEVGNHSVSHPNFIHLSEAEIRSQIAEFDKQCAQYGVRKPTTFAYPGGHHNRKTISVLASLGYTTARRGVDPEYPLLDEGGPGMVYSPGVDDPFLIPSTFVRGPTTSLDQIKHAIAQAKDGKICVLTFHGVPDVHPHCSTPLEVFREYIKLLHDEECTIISIGELAKYVDLSRRPSDPYSPIRARLGITPANLTSNVQIDPNTSARSTVFSWQLKSTRRSQMQAAYQILVASSREQLEASNGDLWDSGKISSDRNYDVVYEGKPLRIGHSYWWKVRCWNEPNQFAQDQVAYYNMPELLQEMRRSTVGPYSRPTVFEYGKLTPRNKPLRFADDTGVIALEKSDAQNVAIKPNLDSDSPRLQVASLTTRRGDVTAKWRHTDRSFVLHATIPVNMTADVHLPKRGWSNVRISGGAADIWRDGKLVDRFNGISSGSDTAEHILLRIGSGQFSFYLHRAE